MLLTPVASLSFTLCGLHTTVRSCSQRSRTHTLLPAHFLYFHLCLSREESGPPDWQADPLLPFVTCTHCKPPTLASQVLGLQARATLLSCMVSFLSFATVYTGFLLVDYQWGKIGVIQKESSPYPFAIDFPGLLKLFSVHHQIFPDSALYSTLVSCVAAFCKISWGFPVRTFLPL